MNKKLVLLISKICLKILKLFGRGSSLPGKIALKLNKNIMNEFEIKGKILAVTGSSGKGSTSSMIVNTLRKLGYSVAHNMKGSNLKFGIATLLIENSNLKGILNQDFIVFEMDERYAKHVFCTIEPDFIVITNITRDQPPRQGNVDIVLEDIKKSIPEKSHIILNSDSPYMQNLVLDIKNPVSYYSVGKNSKSYIENIFSKLNIYYCPKCNSKLNFSYYNFEENGKYTCMNDKCGFEMPTPLCLVTDIDYDNKEITIDNNHKINVQTDLLFNIYNTIACYTSLKLLGVDLDEVCKILNSGKLNKKIYSTYSQNNRKIFILSNKNENATTFNQSLNFINANKESKTIVIGWWQISRRYEFNDISWLYDIDFEILKSHDIENIICVGTERFDIATRIKLAGIDIDKIITFDTLKESVNYIKKNTNSNIYAMLNFDYVTPFNKLIKGEQND